MLWATEQSLEMSLALVEALLDEVEARSATAAPLRRSMQAGQSASVVRACSSSCGAVACVPDTALGRCEPCTEAANLFKDNIQTESLTSSCREDILFRHKKSSKQFRLRLDIQFAVNVAAVNFYRLHREGKLPGYFFIGEATQ